jgi:hypothetical protein
MQDKIRELSPLTEEQLNLVSGGNNSQTNGRELGVANAKKGQHTDNG